VDRAARVDAERPGAHRNQWPVGIETVENRVRGRWQEYRRRRRRKPPQVTCSALARTIGSVAMTARQHRRLRLPAPMRIAVVRSRPEEENVFRAGRPGAKPLRSAPTASMSTPAMPHVSDILGASSVIRRELRRRASRVCFEKVHARARQCPARTRVDRVGQYDTHQYRDRQCAHAMGLKATRGRQGRWPGAAIAALNAMPGAKAQECPRLRF